MQVAVLMGSDSDWKVAKECCEVLKKFKINFEAHVLSAHRSPLDLINYLKHCDEMGCQVFICLAGKAAHLAGVVASHTVQPVIAIPLSSSMLGLDSLLSTVQMPPGVPCATVAIDGGLNGGMLAIQVLALSNGGLRDQLKEHRNALLKSVREKDELMHQWLAAIH